MPTNRDEVENKYNTFIFYGHHFWKGAYIIVFPFKLSSFIVEFFLSLLFSFIINQEPTEKK